MRFVSVLFVVFHVRPDQHAIALSIAVTTLGKLLIVHAQSILKSEKYNQVRV